MTFNIKEVFTRSRQCSSDWLVLQSKSLLDEAIRARNASALVYAALEARNAIEQLWFEIVMLLHGGEIDSETLAQCRKKDGFLNVMRKATPDYYALASFTKLCCSIGPPLLPEIIVWDIKRLKKQWIAVSAYCHTQAHPRDTLADPQWFDKGFQIVQSVFDYMSANMSQADTGIMQPSQMAKHVKPIWEDFRVGAITEEQVLLRLKISQPVSGGSIITP